MPSEKFAEYNKPDSFTRSSNSGRCCLPARCADDDIAPGFDRCANICEDCRRASRNSMHTSDIRQSFRPDRPVESRRLRAIVSPRSRAIESISRPIFPKPIKRDSHVSSFPNQLFVKFDAIHQFTFADLFSCGVRVENGSRADQQALTCIAVDEEHRCRTRPWSSQNHPPRARATDPMHRRSQ